MFPLRDINPAGRLPIVTLGLIAANLLVFIFWQPVGDLAQEITFLYERAAVPCELTTGEPLTAFEINSGRCTSLDSGPAIFPEKGLALSVVVSMFLHGGWLHVLGNMWFLWIFGDNVEHDFGWIGYPLLYLAAGIVATLGFVALHPGETTPLIGASGAVAGVLGAYSVLYPGALVLSVAFFTIIPIPAVLFLGLWFVGQFFVVDMGVAWEAHVAGFLAGMAAALVLRLTGFANRNRGRRRPRRRAAWDD